MSEQNKRCINQHLVLLYEPNVGSQGPRAREPNTNNRFIYSVCGPSLIMLCTRWLWKSSWIWYPISYCRNTKTDLHMKYTDVHRYNKRYFPREVEILRPIISSYFGVFQFIPFISLRFTCFIRFSHLKRISLSFRFYVYCLKYTVTTSCKKTIK